LESARVEFAAETYGASNWVKYNERLEIDLIAMLAIDEAERPSGELVQVWPGGHRARGTDDA